MPLSLLSHAFFRALLLERCRHGLGSIAAGMKTAGVNRRPKNVPRLSDSRAVLSIRLCGRRRRAAGLPTGWRARRLSHRTRVRISFGRRSANAITRIDRILTSLLFTRCLRLASEALFVMLRRRRRIVQLPGHVVRFARRHGCRWRTRRRRRHRGTFARRRRRSCLSRRWAGGSAWSRAASACLRERDGRKGNRGGNQCNVFQKLNA